MCRLTFKEPDGTFGVVGMNDNNESLKTYACICKLLDYEETGFNPSFLSTVPNILADIKERLHNPTAVNIKSCITAINFILKSIEKDR